MKSKVLICTMIGMALAFSLYAQEMENSIAQGDKLYESMVDMETAVQALKMYQQALGGDSMKYDAYWKIARVQYYIGQHTSGKKDKQRIFSQAVYSAQKAIELGPEKPDGHYWLGVNHGVFGEAKGVLKSLSLVKPIKAAMNKVIELDRSYGDGGPDRVLGRVYFKLPGLAGGDKDKSLEHLLKSIEYGPDDAVTRLYLGETYLALGKIEEARAELEYVMQLPDSPLWTTDVAQSKADAQKLLQNKKFK